jgi:hypothetical protein
MRPTMSIAAHPTPIEHEQVQVTVTGAPNEGAAADVVVEFVETQS